jgi:hypothetical protein
MRTLRRIAAASLLAALSLSLVSCAVTFEYDSEKTRVEQTIEDSIMWALRDKDTDLLFGTIAHDPDLFIYHPDSGSTIRSFDAFERMAREVFLDDAFRATRTEIRDLRVHMADCGTVAWFSCLLDDCGEWNGRPIAWLDCRWTGVLEKKKGKWAIMQMHFSFASDAEEGARD